MPGATAAAAATTLLVLLVAVVVVVVWPAAVVDRTRLLHPTHEPEGGCVCGGGVVVEV